MSFWYISIKSRYSEEYDVNICYIFALQIGLQVNHISQKIYYTV